MKKKNHIDTNTRAGKVFDVVNVVFMIVMIFITLYPLYYVLVCSVSDPKLLLAHEGPLAWWLGDFTLEGYQLAMNNPNILLGFGNTMFNLVVGTLANMLLTVLAAFVLTRKYFYLRNFMMKMMIFTMFFSGGLIPLFFVVKHVGIYNTRWANFLPYLISTYNVIIMRSFCMSSNHALKRSCQVSSVHAEEGFSFSSACITGDSIVSTW